MNEDDLRAATCAANRELAVRGLVLHSFGNASGIDRERGVVLIKPSGVPYAELAPEAMVPVALADGRVLAGDLRPSSDTAVHLALYRAFSAAGGVVHTHSTHATAWAQAGRDLPCLGTTHADHCRGPVPCAAMPGPDRVAADYEAGIGRCLVDCFAERRLDPTAVPMVLAAGHGPFTWGPTPAAAVDGAEVLEELARLAWLTLALAPDAPSLPDHLLAKHHERKHGRGAYYGQPGGSGTPGA